MLEASLNERERRVDWPLLASALGLMVLGVVFIWSATANPDPVGGLPWYRQTAFQQAVWCVLGLGVAAAVCLADYRIYARWSYLIYGATILLLIAVLAVGSVRFGARRWIDLGLFQFQPSEFAKVGFLVAMAHFLSRPPEELAKPRLFWLALAMTVVPFALILREPDLGSALVLLPMALVMFFVAGVPVLFLRRLLTGAAAVLGLILVDVLWAPPQWQVIHLEDYQRRRLLVYFGLDYAGPNASEEERRRARVQQLNDSYNVRQALIAVGSGGWTGKGWRQGAQNVLGFLPKGVAHNDFIFSVIAEEGGYMGSATVLGLYTVILFAGLRTASQARDRLGKLLAVGGVTLFFSHVVINIGMNVRLMPVTGIPLPLLSYGGSSVLCSMIAAGLLQNVYFYRKSY
ncbi:MAG TPA: rod shape-determining protein RodA [Candidatus Paceibacterota bacterium]|nr:rod shape-determining protein RodA [Verrucomicrobiota bacterium]HRZ47173.1 rod shape-determining protein RodA [Candidatus Paceibacterota bacterium]HRZ93043.1 rod shape-determining protein RodA [Candidatus Paceibacterota bacterium]